jgi:adenine-specific DNA methylase
VKTVSRPFGEAVIAKTHPPIYLMHKYWARKPHNVVARYIEYYTDPGDVVLDPFMGSGVTVIEAAGLGRDAVGNDLNPIAVLLTEMTLVQIPRGQPPITGIRDFRNWCLSPSTCTTHER